jgi:hypothetical protein
MATKVDGFPLIFQGKKAQVDGSKTAPTEGND